MQKVTQSESLEQQTLPLRVLYNLFIKIADKAAQKLYFKDAEVFWCLMWYFNKATKVKNHGKSGSRDTEVKEPGGSWYEWKKWRGRKKNGKSWVKEGRSGFRPAEKWRRRVEIKGRMIDDGSQKVWLFPHLIQGIHKLKAQRDSRVWAQF